MFLMFDENNKFIPPQSKADAAAGAGKMVADVLEDIRAKRQPNQEALANIIGVMNNRLKEVDPNSQEGKYLTGVARLFTQQLGKEAGYEGELDLTGGGDKKPQPQKRAWWGAFK